MLPRRLDLTAPTRFMGSRRLVREGLLIKAKSGRRLHGFLCSDIMVLTDASLKTLYRLVSFSMHLSMRSPFYVFLAAYTFSTLSCLGSFYPQR